jgi:hypothetical protein
VPPDAVVHGHAVPVALIRHGVGVEMKTTTAAIATRTGIGEMTTATVATETEPETETAIMTVIAIVDVMIGNPAVRHAPAVAAAAAGAVDHAVHVVDLLFKGSVGPWYVYVK